MKARRKNRKLLEHKVTQEALAVVAGAAILEKDFN